MAQRRAITDTAPMADDDIDARARQSLEQFRRRGVARPIIETHIHFYQPGRAGGVPWPHPASATLYRDALPPEYHELARAHGIVAAGIVEASPLVEDNAWVLDLVRDDPFFFFFVGSLEIGTPGFAGHLAQCA